MIYFQVQSRRTAACDPKGIDKMNFSKHRMSQSVSDSSPYFQNQTLNSKAYENKILTCNEAISTFFMLCQLHKFLLPSNYLSLIFFKHWHLKDSFAQELHSFSCKMTLSCHENCQGRIYKVIAHTKKKGFDLREGNCIFRVSWWSWSSQNNSSQVSYFLFLSIRWSLTTITEVRMDNGRVQKKAAWFSKCR